MVGAKVPSALQRVSDALDGIRAPGNFFYSSIKSGPSRPTIHVSDIEIPPSFNQKAIRAAIQESQVATYGPPGQLLSDADVRKTWELHPEQFELQNPEWQMAVDEIARDCFAVLGVTVSPLMQADLHKMVIFEKGGELVRHEDPVDYALGTLVIDVSWLYRGGHLKVHSPGDQSKTYEWVRSRLDNKSISYAAFRADCEYQVQPVEEGYCVLLIYKLLVSEGVSIQPRYSTDHPDFVELSSALDTYFLTSEARTACDSSDLSWYPKEKKRSEGTRLPGGLVYLLDHKYTKNEMRMELFKDKDRVVGSTLARYCYHSGLPYTLYVGNLSYRLAYDPDVDYEAECKEMERTLKFGRGTCHFLSSGGHNAMGISNSHDGFQVDVRTEVAPIGRLASVTFDLTRTKRTRDKGFRRESWYKGTALVIMPLRTELALHVAEGPVDAVHYMCDRPFFIEPHMEIFVRTVFESKHYNWSTGRGIFAGAVDILLKHCPEDMNLRFDLMKSARFIEFLPYIRRLVPEENWEAFATQLIEEVLSTKHGPVSNYRAMVNLICSLLHEETVSNRIQTVFDAVALHTRVTYEKVKYAPYNIAASMHFPRIPIEVLAEELTRLLRLAEKATNPDTLLQCISFRAASIPDSIVPAFSSFRDSSFSLDVPHQFSANVFQCAVMLKEELRAWLPSETSWKLDGIPLPSDLCFDRQCKDCKTVEEFLADEKERQLTLRISRPRRDHVKRYLKYFATRFILFEVDEFGKTHALRLKKLKVNEDRRDDGLNEIRCLEEYIPEGFTFDGWDKSHRNGKDISMSSYDGDDDDDLWTHGRGVLLNPDLLQHSILSTVKPKDRFSTSKRLHPPR